MSEEVSVGHETKIACHDAVEYWKACYGRTPTGIIATAGWSEEYKVVMSEVMVDFMRQGLVYPTCTIARSADYFNTDGEVRALVDFLRINLQIKEVVIVAKWWHIWRVKMLLRYYLAKDDRRNLKINVRSCHSDAGWQTIAYEIIVARIGEWFRVRLRRASSGKLQSA